MDIFFGVFNAEEDFTILNHLILTAKYIYNYIYKCKLNCKNPSIRVYKAKIREIYQVELKIAAKQNKLAKHFQKWGKLCYISVCGMSVVQTMQSSIRSQILL